MFMNINPFSFSNLLLVFISVALIVYLVRVGQVIKQKTTTAEFRLLRKPVVAFFSAYAIYFTGLSVLAAGHFFDEVTMPPRALVVFLPLLFVVALLSKVKINGPLRFLSFVPPAMLIGVHLYRLFIELVFLQFAEEKIIPEALSLHGRNFDLSVGVVALPVAFVLHKKYAMARTAGIFFNLFGLLSLVNIFSIVVPSVPSSFRVYDTLYLPTYFPGILIVFLASFAIFLHILSLRQLLLLKDTSPAKKAVVKSVQRPRLEYNTTTKNLPTEGPVV